MVEAFGLLVIHTVLVVVEVADFPFERGTLLSGQALESREQPFHALNDVEGTVLAAFKHA